MLSEHDANELAGRRRLETIANTKRKQDLDPSNRDPWPSSSTSKGRAVDDVEAVLRQHCAGSMDKAQDVLLTLIIKSFEGWRLGGG